MTSFEAFVSGPATAVVRIADASEWDDFLALCEVRGLSLSCVNSLRRIGFESAHRSGGVQVVPDGELCVEYIIGKGFTFAARKNYEDYSECIIDFDDFSVNTEIL